MNFTGSTRARRAPCASSARQRLAEARRVDGDALDAPDVAQQVDERAAAASRAARRCHATCSTISTRGSCTTASSVGLDSARDGQDGGVMIPRFSPLRLPIGEARIAGRGPSPSAEIQPGDVRLAGDRRAMARVRAARAARAAMR